MIATITNSNSQVITKNAKLSPVLVQVVEGLAIGTG
jgi:hypothetical protein